MYRIQDRFTHTSRTGRGKIPKDIRVEIFSRDRNVCQFCKESFSADLLTIDHLIPLAQGGLDEVTNYVTACRKCNEKKSALPLSEFAASLGLQIAALPIHGDPVIDNQSLPIQIRMIRREIVDRIRSGELQIVGKSGQKKLERSYRHALWRTPTGTELKAEFPLLPGHVLAIIPEIRTIAKSLEEELFLIEIAKVSKTRNFIGSIFTKDRDLWSSLAREMSRRDLTIQRRLNEALERFAKELRKQNLSYPAHAPYAQPRASFRKTDNA